jgi:hypothetical protein
MVVLNRLLPLAKVDIALSYDLVVFDAPMARVKEARRQLAATFAGVMAHVIGSGVFSGKRLTEVVYSAYIHGVPMFLAAIDALPQAVMPQVVIEELREGLLATWSHLTTHEALALGVVVRRWGVDALLSSPDPRHQDRMRACAAALCFTGFDGNEVLLTKEASFLLNQIRTNRLAPISELASATMTDDELACVRNWRGTELLASDTPYALSFMQSAFRSVRM